MYSRVIYIYIDTHTHIYIHTFFFTHYLLSQEIGYSLNISKVIEKEEYFWPQSQLPLSLFVNLSIGWS